MISQRLLLVIFFSTITMCVIGQQGSSYADNWKKVDELIVKKNLPRSALTIVKQIYARAKAENNDPQLIKALVYRSSLQVETREDNQQLAIMELESEPALQKEPAASLRNSLLANLYWQYYQQHRWQLYNRTTTINFIKGDVSTWTTEDFHRKISSLFLRSIEKEQLLQSVPVERFEALLIKGNARALRPTLFDLLAHHALDYFRSTERDLKKPAYAFELSDSAAYAPAAQFATHVFASRDTSSLQRRAVRVYQQLIRMHLRDKDPQALADVDMERLLYVHQSSTGAEKDRWYVRALKRLAAAYKSQDATAKATYYLSLYHETRAAQYHPFRDTSARWERKEASAILERVVRDSSIKGEGWTLSFNLLQQILRPSLSFELEKVNIPLKPLRARVQYRSVAAVTFKLIAATEEIKAGVGDETGKNFWALLDNAPSVRTWTQTLPETGDLQEHSAEVKIDALPVGAYVLLATTGDAQSTKKVAGAQLFHVSSISYVHNRNAFFVLHRESGMPLAAAGVDVYAQQYNYTTGKYSRNKVGSYQTDKNGYFFLARSAERGEDGFALRIRHGSDHLWQDDRIYDYRPYDRDQLEKIPKERLFLFTDRSIYRPGQTVFFKGIVIGTHKGDNRVAAGFRAQVQLRDVNNRVVDSVLLTANEYGSFNGKFTLPENVLNGVFQITDRGNLGQVDFHVEEYKRPKFYVAFEKVTDTYRVQDTIRLQGKAAAYAGNNVDAARVVYRVVRQPRFPYPWRYARSWWPQSPAQEIAHGETTTGSDGRFTILFPALADKTLDPVWEPVFDYRVYADVTDRAGETRSSEYAVSAGYKSLVIQLDLQEKMPLDSLEHLMIRTENMNGSFQSAQLTVQVRRLLPEQRMIRERLWEQPDQFVMDRNTFVGHFPNDEYRNESDPKNWATGEVIWGKSDSSRVSGYFPIDSKDLSPGFYQVSVSTTDQNGALITDIRYIELYDPTSKILAMPTYFWKLASKAIEPGAKTSVELGTSVPGTFVIQQVEKRESQGEEPGRDYTFLTLGAGRRSVAFGATENDRGGYGVHFFFVRDNRFYSFSDAISVPWTNRELDISFGTFRDKTLPGSEEKWTVNVRGRRGEKWAAEMLASMYDASLDAFHPHAWQRPDIWKTYFPSFSWQARQSFAAVQSNTKWEPEIFRTYEKSYDQLLFEQVDRGVVFHDGYGGSRAEVARSVANAAPDAERQEEKVRDLKTATEDGAQKAVAPPKNEAVENIAIRKNFNETAFFFPELETDAEGNVTFSFTLPEALTRWKIQALAHTKDLAFGMGDASIITQKELMVQPAAPRFLRQGDRLEFNARIVNLSGKELTGQAELQLRDAKTDQPVDGWFLNSFPNQYFTVAAGSSEVVKFPMEVPYQFSSALVWKIVARAGAFSDAEEMALPVLSNKMLVTESLPLPMRGTGTKTFTLQKLVTANSPTLVHHGLTVEYTANPAWYAVQALPFLMEGSTETVEGAWNRYYANALAARIVSASPKIASVLLSWKGSDTTAFLSNLHKNASLRSALLEETPWVLQAKTEAQQRQNIALLFDLVRTSRGLNSSLERVNAAQMPSGGFAWMPGAPEDRYMTGYLLTGIARLRKLGALPAPHLAGLRTMEERGRRFLLKGVEADYAALRKRGVKLSQNNLGSLAIQYLYIASMQDKKGPESPAVVYFREQAARFWMTQGKYMQGMIALALHNHGDGKTPVAILKSLKETAVQNGELGMYWKDNGTGSRWFWWQAPIETQALLIEVFSAIGRDEKAVDDLTTWLLKNKQTVSWRTTKATADACYALLLRGADLLAATPNVQVSLAGVPVTSKEVPTEAGTGYVTKRIEGAFVKPAMGNISVTVDAVPGARMSASWGAVYWQYFEELDKITPAATPLQLQKKLFVETNSDRGPVLTPVGEATSLNPGTRIKVRIELRVDRDMEYVHMKDQRSSALEPVNVLSAYKWQGGLGYYETTKDASTSFFFPFLRKGSYVFEYSLFVTHTGSFSNGITTIQSMYAPEFSAHSEGVRLNVE